MVKLSKNQITIITKDGCGYCSKAKSLLKKEGYFYKEIELTSKNKAKIYNKLDKITGSYRYFPMIFIEKEFLGGYDKLEKLMKLKKK